MTPGDTAGYIGLFLKSAKEHIQALEILLSSEKLPDTKEIFRHIHSLKGASQMMGYKDIAALCTEIIGYIRPEGVILKANEEHINSIKRTIEHIKERLRVLEPEKMGEVVS